MLRARCTVDMRAYLYVTFRCLGVYAGTVIISLALIVLATERTSFQELLHFEVGPWLVVPVCSCG